ncbi:NADH pyrophosphatase [Pseudohongiella nitratireducens]|uniref:NAD(+) diphosphatase n=1 Tax=Pseudohongiella nitratireducens TaxID=1768907 RepID=A0A916VJ33_9GAMM|nr:NAD(+) diphosphatase [Pseudohongiella nitratireducens]GFZ76425.1 NADH pyrophosphatase [Pseudohongiella nitratireducens]
MTPQLTPPHDNTVSVIQYLFRGRECIVTGSEPAQWLSGHATKELERFQSLTRLQLPALSVKQPGCEITLLEEGAELPGHMEPMPMRDILMTGSFDSFAPLGRAGQVAQWFNDHRYCGRCAAPMQPATEQLVLSCSSCQHHVYPRINPCIIVLITRGREVLLASHHRHGKAFYSCLAGFIEAGESAEDAVHREVMEEVGIKIGNLRYLGSQPWPFPSQLMFGFYADYESGEIDADQDEIEDAVWFDIDDLPFVPNPEISIAGRLIAGYRQSQLNKQERQEKGDS